jgi:hypothetical protein
MEYNKCAKYIYKLQNTSVNDNKFGVYLTKLNHLYGQIGGGQALLFKYDITLTIDDKNIAEKIQKYGNIDEVHLIGKFLEYLEIYAIISIEEPKKIKTIVTSDKDHYKVTIKDISLKHDKANAEMDEKTQLGLLAHGLNEVKILMENPDIHIQREDKLRVFFNTKKDKMTKAPKIIAFIAETNFEFSFKVDFVKKITSEH